MPTRLIRLEDETLVEIEVPEDYAEPISSDTAKKVKATIDDSLKPTLLHTIKPIKAVWEELGKDMIVEKAEVELSFGFEIEGNLYVTKSKANANLTVKLILAPPK